LKQLWWQVAGLFIWSAAFNLTVPILPLIATDLGAVPFQVGLLQGTALVFTTLTLIVAGQAADRYGQRLTLVALWVVGATGALLLLAARSWPGLVPGAALLYAGSAGVPALGALVTGTRPVSEHRRALGLLFMAAPAGMLVGSSAAGYIAERWGSPALHIATGVLTLLAAAALLPVRAGAPSRGHGGTAGGGSTSPGSSPSPDRTPAPPRPIFLAAGLAAAAVFLLLALPSGFMTPYLRDVMHLSLPATGITNGQLAVGQIAWSALLAVWPPESGQVVLRLGAMGTLRLSRGTLIAMAVCLGANALFGVLFPLGATTATVIGAILLRGAFFGLQPLGMALVSDLTGTGAGLTGRFSLLAILMGLASACAPVLAGALYGFRPAAPFWVAGATGLLGAMLLAGVVALNRARVSP